MGSVERLLLVAICSKIHSELLVQDRTGGRIKNASKNGEKEMLAC
jgi:hypothetical protein